MMGKVGIGTLAVVAMAVLYLIVGWIADRHYQGWSDE